MDAWLTGLYDVDDSIVITVREVFGEKCYMA